MNTRQSIQESSSKHSQPCDSTWPNWKHNARRSRNINNINGAKKIQTSKLSRTVGKLIGVHMEYTMEQLQILNKEISLVINNFIPFLKMLTTRIGLGNPPWKLLCTALHVWIIQVKWFDLNHVHNHIKPNFNTIRVNPNYNHI